MIYQELLPHSSLQPFINKFWYLEGVFPHRREKIFPLPYIHLIINLSKPYILYTDPGLEKFVTFDSGFISGIQERFLVIENPKKVNNIGVEFKPFGLAAFINVSMNKIANKVIRLNGIFNDSEFLASNIKGLTPKQSLNELHSFVLSKLRKDSPDFSLTAKFDEIVANKPSITVQKAAVELGVTEKHLISEVKKYTGLTPKSLADIYNFQQVMRMIDKQKPKQWTNIAMQNDYYDQAHFIKVFKNFTGFTPTRYVELLNQFDSGYLNFVALDNSNR